MIKNKFFKLFIVATLIATISGTVLSAGCKTVEPFEEEQHIEYVGTHDISVTETDRDFIKDGTCDYVVVIPTGAKSVLVEAKNDFLILFKKATGISLSVKYDGSLSGGTINTKYISLGETSLVASAGIDESEYSVENLKTEGVRIITKNGNVYILGGSDLGVSNGVYKFLEIYFNFDYYQRTCIDLDTNVLNCKFKDMDITDVPDIDHFYGADYVYQWGRGAIQPLDTLALGSETASEEITYMNHRSGYHRSTNELLLPVHTKFDKTSSSATMHNVLEYLPRGSVDDKCYSHGSQLCYTAHGDAEVLERMIDYCAEKVIFSLKSYTPDKYPYQNYVSFTMEDNSDICSCSACKEDYETIGYSGNLIKFVNRMGKKVQDWLDQQKDETAEFHSAYRENFKILTYGYNIYTDPPVNELGEPLSDEVICYDNIGIWHVSSRGISDYADLYDAKTSDVDIKQINGWKTITQKSKCLWFWHNSGNVTYNGWFSDGFTTYSNNFYKVFADAGYEYVYAAHYLNGGGELTAWQNLLCYIQNKLRWDCNRDMDFYIRKYMKAMFLDGATEMYNLLKDERIYYANLVSKLEYDDMGDWGRNIKSEENYPYMVLKGWLARCDKAIDQIEYLKNTNPTEYTLAKQRIEIEAAAHLFRITDLYGSSSSRPFSESLLAEYKTRMRAIGSLSPNLKIEGVALTSIK
jgi:hypothetical protein